MWAEAVTAPSSSATPRCPCSRSGSAPRRPGSSTSPRSSSGTSASTMPPEDEYRAERLRMVDEQLRARDIVDERVLAALERVPRELFVSEEERSRAYDDAALPIGHGQTISQPYMVARIVEALALTGGEKVLDVGTGSGYQAAVVAELGADVHTIER